MGFRHLSLLLSKRVSVLRLLSFRIFMLGEPMPLPSARAGRQGQGGRRAAVRPPSVCHFTTRLLNRHFLPGLED